MRILALLTGTALVAAPPLPKDAARVVFFQATPSIVKPGDPVELRWMAAGVDNVRIEPLDKEQPATGKITVNPGEKTVYWIHAYNDKGGESVPAEVDMLRPMVVHSQEEPAPAAEPGKDLPALSGVKPVGVPRPEPKVQAKGPAKVIEAPRNLAQLPAVAGGQAVSPSTLPEKGIWVQFAALFDGAKAQDLKAELEKLTGHPVLCMSAVDKNGKPINRIRMGPFPAKGPAFGRIKEIRSKIQGLDLKPQVIID